MTNKKYCKVCSEHVTIHELKCSFCKHYFHIKCCKVDLSDAVIINKDTGIHWFCNQCNIFSQTDIMVSLLDKVNLLQGSVDKMATTIQSLVESSNFQKRNEIISDKNDDSPAANTRRRVAIKRKGAEINDPLLSVISKKISLVTDEASTSEQPAHNKTFREVVSEQPFTPVTSTLPSNLIISSVAVDANNDLDNGIAPLTTVEGLRWIFLSRLSPETQEIQVTSHLAKQLSVNTTDIICKKIVKRGSDADNLSYSSFKIGVKSSLFDAAVLRSTWLPGNIVHEFKPRSKNWPRLPAQSRIL